MATTTKPKTFWDDPAADDNDPYRDPANWPSPISSSADPLPTSSSRLPSGSPSASPLPTSAPLMSAMDMPDNANGDTGAPAGGAAAGGGQAAPPSTTQMMNAPYQYPWQQASDPMQIWQFNNLKSTFPDMSDQEVWQHLNYDKAPDHQFMQAIIANIKAHRAAHPTAAPNTSTSTTSTTAPTGTGNFQNDFWTAVQGMPVSRGNLQPVVDKLVAMGYKDAKVTGADTIFANGQEWDIVPAGDGQWQLIPDAGGNGGGGGAVTGYAGATSITSAANPFRDKLLAALTQMIHDNSGPTGDQSGTPEMMAFRTANKRESDFERSALAERMSAEGLGNVEGGGSGAFTGEAIGLEQAQGERNAQYEAELTHRILTEKQGRLIQALQLGAGYLTDEQRLQLQEALQNTNASLDITRMMLQNQQFYDNLYTGG